MIERILKILVFAALACRLHAQLPQYHAQVFGENYGFGDGLIFDVFTDKDQFVWASTLFSLQRFDGRSVRKYHFENVVTYAICDDMGKIWVLSGPKVYRNRPDWNGFEKLPFDTTGGVLPRAIFQLQGSPVYVLTTKGLYAWSEDTGQFSRLNLELPAIGPRHAITRFDTCQGTIMYPVNNGMCSYNMSTGLTRTVTMPGEYSMIFSVTPDLAVITGYLDDAYWLDFRTGKYWMIDAKHYGLSKSGRRMPILSFAPLGDGTFLVGTKFGLCKYDLIHDSFQVESVFAEGKPISNEKILYRIFQDRNGTFWSHSLTFISAIRPLYNSIGLLRNFHYEASERWDDRIYGITADNAGNIWFGGTYGFKKLNVQTLRSHIYSNTEGARDRLNDHVVRDLKWDGSNLIIAMANHGMWLFNPKTETYRRPRYIDKMTGEYLEGDVIDQIGAMNNGDYIVCGRFHTYCIKKGSYETRLIRFPRDNVNMNTACQDQQGRVWLGSNYGIHCLDAEYRFLFDVSFEPRVNVRYFLPKSDNELLVGTEKGLFQLSLKSENRYDLSPVQWTPEPIGIASMYRDSLDRVWLGTSDGLYLTGPELKHFQKFDFSDNIQSHVYTEASIVRAGNGMLFLAGMNGINYFKPENIAMGDRPLRVNIESLDINSGDSIIHYPAGGVRLKPWQNMLSFEVVAPYYNNASKVHYRYRLQHYSDDWVDIGTSNYFRIAHLPPGVYQLEVAASVEGRTWYPGERPLIFEVATPFWQTWWFRLALVLGIAGALVLMIRLREKRLQAHQKRQLELEKLRNTALQYELETEQVVHYFSRSINDARTVNDALWSVAKQCIARFGWEDCVIYLLDSKRKVLVQTAAWGQKSTDDNRIINPIEIKPGEGIVGAAALEAKAILINDTAKDPRYIIDDKARGSELAVPILAEGQVIGVIDSEHTKSNFYTPWHLQILTAIAALCSHKIALAKSEESRQQALLQSIDNQRKAAESRLQSLRLQMNPHFLFNALNSIQQMTMTGNSDGAAMYLSKFSKLLRMVLTLSDQDRVSLRDELAMLNLYLELESLRFDDTFRYTLTCDEEIDLDEYKVPTLLIQPFVENAIWHGLLQKEGTRTLNIRFSLQDDDDLVCTIEDNGIGRKAARNFSAKSQHTGKGLSVSEDRLVAINQQQNQHNKLEILDLVDGSGQASGTLVRLTFG